MRFRIGQSGEEGDERIARLERRLEATERALEETQRLALVGNWEWTIDEEGVWHPTWSRQMQRIFGRDPDGPAPTLEDLLAAIHPDDRSGFEAAVERITSSQGPFRHGYRIVDTSGQVRHLRTCWEVDRGRTGSSKRTYGVTQDISELKHSQEQLERAQRLEAVGQLAGGVAHDFNNLLAVILNNAECLAEELGEPDAGARVAEIERAAAAAAELPRQLLQISRRDSTELRTVDLAEAVREAEALLRRTLGEHIELVVEVPAGLPPVRLGTGQTEQILVNLAVNARDALPRGGTISISLTRPPAVPIVVLRVADDGVGMSEEVAEQAFDPFFTTKPREQGTGLGLAAVYGIVGRAGGHVEVESQPGRGTEVTVYLPVAEDEAKAGAGGTAAAAAPPPGGAGTTVLVVDNEEAVRQIVAHMLVKRGYRVRSAAGAAEAEALIGASGGEVDVLLTDVLMPEVSGPELVARLRERGVDPPTVYMSGYGHDALAPEPWGDGAAFLQKPFKAEELLRAVGEALVAAEEGR